MTASTWLAFIERDIYSTLGWVSFAIILLSMMGVVVIIARGLRASSVVMHALDVNLDRWRTVTTPEIERRLRKKFMARALLGPFFVRSYGVRRKANISYGDAGKRNLLDVYHHHSYPPGAPILIHLHGGGFVSGKKNRQSLPLLYRFASRGWVCISANYRLRPTAQFPDHLIDLKKVIAWVRKNGHEYNANPSCILVAGNSAGGHLAAMATLTPNDPAFQPGFESVDTSVTAAISLYGYYGALNTREGLPSSPFACNVKEAPPFLIAHGDRDTIVSVEHARSFVQHVRTSSSHPVVYVELPGAEHNFDLFHSIRNEAVIGGIEVFSDWVLAQGNHHDRRAE
ncbi:alpha/beta hydrolase [Pseudalkalibacillus hwajinpoensis]|uniref:alpha/beta hydrolase n=1 Tax=Guptibacillus hwajinpoensis TaxID=208199 RepID=UPI00325C201C